MSQQKKILILGWRDPKNPLAGGAEQVVHEHAKAWVKAGNKVTLFSSIFSNALAFEKMDGINIIRAGHPYFFGVQLAAYLYYKKRSSEFDLIVDQFHGFPFFTPFYVKQPTIALIQEVAKEVWFLNPLPKPFNLLVGILGFIIEPFIFKFYHHLQFMTGSNSAQKEVNEYGIPLKNITVIPHGVLISKNKKNNKKEKIKTIVFLGALTKDKGIEDAINCFSILNTKDKFQFWIIGKGDRTYLKYLYRLIAKLKIKNQIKFWGFVSQNKKFELLAKAHILINPSVREGWGLVNIESNSVSTPVVAYNSVGIIDSVKNGYSGILCDKNNPQELAWKVNLLLNENTKYLKLQKEAIKWANQFNWEKSAKLSLKLINKMLRY